MMRGTDEIVAVAEELLSKRFGGTQSLTDIENSVDPAPPLCSAPASPPHHFFNNAPWY